MHRTHQCVVVVVAVSCCFSFHCGGPLDESRTHTPYWNPGLSRARLPVPPQGVVPTQHSPSLAYKELRWAIQLCIQHSTGTNTMLRDLDQPTH